MKTVLVINSSLNSEAGNSFKATQKYIESMKSRYKGNPDELNIISLDLVKEDLGHLSAQEMQAWGTDAAERTEEQSKLASFSDKYISLLEQSDEIVMGVPMYNFGIPSVLKAFFDRVARAGHTFSYTSNGPEGLLKNKKAIVLAARGGKYEGTALDTQSAYLKNFLNFLGISDTSFVYVEGLAMGDNAATEAWTKFNEKISELN